jgi:glutaminase
MAGKASVVDVKQLRQVVDDVVGRLEVIEHFGRAAEIKALKEVETDRFGMAVATSDGNVVLGGEAETTFPIQSISKVFALTIALKVFGGEVWKRVGREPSGDPFNSIVDLERLKGIPRNPLINAGALVICDMLADIGKQDRDEDKAGGAKARGGRGKDGKTAALPRTVRDFLEAEIGEKDLAKVSEIVEQDGKTAGFSNRALAFLAKGFGNLNNDVEAVMKLYVEQCAVALSCRQLALAGRYLMIDTANAKGEVSEEHASLARRVNAMMLTCGQYDGSGDFAFRVGLPAKSGVGGGMLAIVPNVASVAVWSPGLDDNGNSLLGTLALEQLADRMDWSVFGARRRH